MSGLLGSYDLKGGVTQSICQCDVDGFTTANVSICNRHNVPVRVHLALTQTENTFDDGSVYVEYETILQPKGVLERSAIALSPGTYITVWSDNSHVSAIAYGIRAGDEVSVTPITTNTDTDAPVLVETDFTFNQLDLLYEYQLATNNEDGVVIYSTTDTLPAGLRLTTSGLITGKIGTGAAAGSIDVTATDGSGNSSVTAVNLNITDGSSAALAAPSAQFIKTLTGTNTDGTYWIDLPTSGATETYCVMDSRASGGGWMLAMKATRGNTFNNTSTYWENTTLLNETDLTVNDADAKYAVFNEYKGNDIGARFPDVSAGGVWGNQLGGWTMSDDDAFENSTLLNVFQGSQITIRSQGDVDSWIGLGKNSGGPFSTQDGFRWQGINYQGNSSNLVRYGFAWNNETDEASNDVSGGIGMNRLDASTGDVIGCCQTYTGVQRTMRMELYVR